MKHSIIFSLFLTSSLLFLSACNYQYYKKNVKMEEIVETCEIFPFDSSLNESKLKKSLSDLILLYKKTDHDNEEEKNELNKKIFEFTKLYKDDNLNSIFSQLCNLCKKNKIQKRIYNNLKYDIFEYFYYTKFKDANELTAIKKVYKEMDSQKSNYGIILEIHHHICSNLLTKLAHERIYSNMMANDYRKQHLKDKDNVLFILETALEEYASYDEKLHSRIQKDAFNKGDSFHIMSLRYGYWQSYLTDALFDLGRVHIYYGNFDKALEYLEEMKNIIFGWYEAYPCTSLPDDYLNNLSYLFHVYHKLSKNKEARDLSEYIYTNNQICEFEPCFDKYRACPWIYVFNGDKYEKKVEILQNIVGKENEQNQIVLIGKIFIKNNLVKIQIREEKNEISYINQISLIINDEKIYSDNNILSSVDEKYLILKKGDICDLNFFIPTHLIEYMDEDTYIEATGFYTYTINQMSLLENSKRKVGNKYIRHWN